MFLLIYWSQRDSWAILEISWFYSAECDKTTRHCVTVLFWLDRDWPLCARSLCCSKGQPVTHPDTNSNVRPAYAHTQKKKHLTPAATSRWPSEGARCGCYKTKRWTLSCLKALLGVSEALSHVMLLVPIFNNKYTHTIVPSKHTTHACITTVPTCNTRLWIRFAFLHSANIVSPDAHSDTITTALSQHIIRVPLQRGNHLSSLSS